MKKITLVMLGLSLMIVSQAQTMFDKGVSGLSVFVGSQESYWEDGFYGGLQYTYKGAFDLYGFYGNYQYNKSHLEDMGVTLDTSPKEGVFILGAEYWVLRTDPGNDRGVNVGIWTEYEMESYTDSEYTYKESLYEDVSGSAFAIGLDFSVDFTIKKGWRLQPYTWIGKVWAAEEYKQNGTDYKDNVSGTCAGLGVVLQKMLKNGSSVWLSTEWDMDDLDYANDTAFEMTLGYNLGFGKK
ncbi:MAG: hypothetical protein HOE45_00930 [Gammaproteobacteria bacterium]|jgi:hypothetical protein|nr:hypothetical protein [Gammaproteobacteria bacterium]MBT4683994.1 hypothetical protein [Chloroflexota bacterium]MBT6301886.1 hypothetical protein [Candidatus Neomarinimicrobiota bacterium]